MEENRESEIQKLAESLAENYFIGSAVDPYSIADDYEIEVVPCYYEDSYKGIIWPYEGKFYIHINLSKVKSPYFSEGRFTCAHELGHFFIKEHYDALKKGYKISFSGDYCDPNNDPFEKEADCFAANLLLPKKKVIETSTNLEPGLNAILDIKDAFKTSITCTAKQYVNLNLSPSILVTIDGLGRISTRAISPSFKKLSIDNSSVMYNPKRFLQERKDCKHLKTGVRFTTGYTLLQNWIPFLDKEHSTRVVFEETMTAEKGNWSMSLITLV